MEISHKRSLYGSLTSPYVRHCRIALEQSGLDWHFVDADNALSGKRSPTKKVPFFVHGDLLLSDSSSILRHIRECSGSLWLDQIEHYDMYLLVNTLLDSAINLFLLAREDCTPDNTVYLRRQRSRVIDGLRVLNDYSFGAVSSPDHKLNDAELRLACFLDWGLHRNQFLIEGLTRLQELLNLAKLCPHFFVAQQIIGSCDGFEAPFRVFIPRV